jgi:hypothetical protein
MVLRPAGIQTSLRIRAVWLGSMLFAISFSTCNRVGKRTAWILIRLRGSMLVANPLCWFSHGAAHLIPIATKNKSQWCSQKQLICRQPIFFLRDRRRRKKRNVCGEIFKISYICFVLTVHISYFSWRVAKYEKIRNPFCLFGQSLPNSVIDNRYYL